MCRTVFVCIHKFAYLTDTTWLLCTSHMIFINEMYVRSYVSTYVLVRYSMKNAARCDTHCELYDSVNPLEYECIMYCRNISERLSVSVATTFAYLIDHADVEHVNTYCSCRYEVDKLNTLIAYVWPRVLMHIRLHTRSVGMRYVMTGILHRCSTITTMCPVCVNMISCLHTRRI